MDCTIMCVGQTYAVFAVFLQAVECLAVVEEVGTKCLDTFMGLFLFGGNKLLFRRFGVVVDGPRQGC